MDDSAAPFRHTYDQLLIDAVKALTAAARLSWTLHGPDGSVRTGPCDWAEFVALALAGATANVGSVEAVLAGRPGSWEADVLRGLLTGTVGYDEQQLLEHRTEPVVVTIIVDDIMLDLEIWQAYDEASTALQRRYDDLRLPSRTGSPGAVPEDLLPATPEQERHLEGIAALEEQLEEQRQQDWAAYGAALKTYIEAQVPQVEGLRVPVLVSVDLEAVVAYGASGTRGSGWGDPLADSLLRAAVDATRLPGNGQTPLERLLEGLGPGDGTVRPADVTP
jgi:hypothetical protein